MFNRLIKSLCRECGEQKRNVKEHWCPACFSLRDAHIKLYIDAVRELYIDDVLALSHNVSDQDEVDELVNTAIADLRALPPGDVVLALRDTLWRVKLKSIY